MLQSTALDDLLFEVLKANTTLTGTLSGGIYVKERPADSNSEDVVVNCFTLTHTMPQAGTTNVNIHVPDKKAKIKGKEQYVIDRERIRTITNLVINTLQAARLEGLTISVVTENTIKEPSLPQHYNNIRIEWNITRTN